MVFVKESILPRVSVGSPYPGLFLSLFVGKTVKGCQDKFSAPACAFSSSLPPLF